MFSNIFAKKVKPSPFHLPTRYRVRTWTEFYMKPKHEILIHRLVLKGSNTL